MLCSNALPHLATAVTGHSHLTPVAGRGSNRSVNAAWGAANLLGGLALTAMSARGPGRWDQRLLAFNAGGALFSVWSAVAEYSMELNWDR